ncbi:MAG: pseudaminic acid synthase [Paracoccaceae bacterium]
MKFNKSINIGNKTVSSDGRVFIIAEISANHNNDIDRAKAIIRKAAENGADAIKLQTYTADTITLESDRPEFVIQGGLWDKRTLYDLYTEGSLPWEWHRELINYAKDFDLAVLSSPFDESAVDFLVDLGIDGLKIASFEINHIPLLQHAAKQGLPLIVSTGMATSPEIKEAVHTINNFTSDLILLHCISSYPAKAKDYSLRSVSYLIDTFGALVGLSDHCEDNLASAVAIALGASVVEKHFTLDRDGGGLDDSFSLEPDGLLDLRVNVDTVKDAMRLIDNGVAQSEENSLMFRRSIYACKSIKKGEAFSTENIKVIRPSCGLHPRYFGLLIGQIATRDIEYATPLMKSDIPNEVL